MTAEKDAPTEEVLVLDVLSGLCVDTTFVKLLSKYQKEGVKKIYERLFENKTGCILAHAAGSGKTFTTIALLHTVMMSSCMASPIENALVIVPFAVANYWVEEIRKWNTKLQKSKRLTNIVNLCKSSKLERPHEIAQWKEDGGILIATPTLFRTESQCFAEAQPDLLVLDEAHVMVNTTDSKLSKQLQKMSTSRRILLSGTPLATLDELHKIVCFASMELGGTLKHFRSEYRNPIMSGQPIDASDSAKAVAEEKQIELRKLLTQCLHRVRKEEALSQLTPPKKFTIYVNPSSIQETLWNRFQGYAESKGNNMFLSKVHIFSLIHASPQTLFKATNSNGAKYLLQSLNAADKEAIEDPFNSPKLVLCNKIIDKAHSNQEKVLIFSHHLATLTVLEAWLNKKKWKKGQEFLRIDGSTGRCEREQLCKDFNDKKKNFHVALMTPEAGGLGLNMQAASRVVNMEPDFNPTTTDQCIGRAHWLGQEKPVVQYVLSAKDSIEAGTLARAGTKQVIQDRVLDGMQVQNKFTSKELANLNHTPRKAICNKCKQERQLPDGVSYPTEQDPFYCINIGRRCATNPTLTKKRNECKKKSTDPIVQMLIEERDSNGNPFVSAWCIHDNDVPDKAPKRSLTEAPQLNLTQKHSPADPSTPTNRVISREEVSVTKTSPPKRAKYAFNSTDAN